MQLRLDTASGLSAAGDSDADGEFGRAPLRRRIDVDSALPPVAIPRRLLNEIFTQAIETLPEECCGLVLGTAGERYREVARCRNEMTRLHRRDPETFPRDGREAFYMSERDYLEAKTRAEVRGERVTAVYHSHVDYGAYLSELDQAYAAQALFPFPDADQLVVSVLDGRVGAAAVFRRAPGVGAFRGHAVIPATP